MIKAELQTVSFTWFLLVFKLKLITASWMWRYTSWLSLPTYPPCTPVPPGSPSCPSAAEGVSECGRRHGSSSCRRWGRRWWLWAGRLRLHRCQWWREVSGHCQSRYGVYLGSTPDHQPGSTDRETTTTTTGLFPLWSRCVGNVVLLYGSMWNYHEQTQYSHEPQ